MCDSTVYLFAQKNREDIPSEQKIRKIVPQYMESSDSLLSVTDEPLLIHRTSRGKPFLPQLSDLHISVSHSGEWFVCAISNQPVGIDLREHTLLRGETQEQVLIRYGKIARRFFHPLEADFVEANPKNRFFPVWTAKESYVKYTSQGIDEYYDSFCVLNRSSAAPRLPAETSWQAEQVSFLQVLFTEAIHSASAPLTPAIAVGSTQKIP